MMDGSAWLRGDHKEKPIDNEALSQEVRIKKEQIELGAEEFLSVNSLNVSDQERRKNQVPTMSPKGSVHRLQQNNENISPKSTVSDSHSLYSQARNDAVTPKESKSTTPRRKNDSERNRPSRFTSVMENSPAKQPCQPSNNINASISQTENIASKDKTAEVKQEIDNTTEPERSDSSEAIRNNSNQTPTWDADNLNLLKKYEFTKAFINKLYLHKFEELEKTLLDRDKKSELANCTSMYEETNDSKYNVMSKRGKTNANTVTQLKDIIELSSDESDSAESILEVPIPPKPKPPVINLPDSEEGSEPEDTEDPTIIEKETDTVANVCEEMPRDKSPYNLRNNQVRWTDDAVDFTDSVWNIDTNDLIVNYTKVQKGAGSLEEIKEMSNSVQCDKSPLTSRSTSLKITKDTSKTHGSKNEERILGNESITKPNIVPERDKSHLPRSKEGVTVQQLPNSVKPSRKRRYFDIDNESSTCAKYPKMSCARKDAKMEDEEEYLNEELTGGHFNMDEIQSKMSKNPRLWAILDEDLMPKPKNRSVIVKCTLCFREGHARHDCPDRRKPQRCRMCGEEGHPDTWCPQRMCLTCGKKQQRYRQTCDACRILYCSMCKSVGHEYRDCPDLWRRFHQTTQSEEANVPDDSEIVMKPTDLLVCCNCTKKGHDASMCRNFRWTAHFPTPSFVSNYVDGPGYVPPSEQSSVQNGPSVTSSNIVQQPQPLIDPSPVLQVQPPNDLRIVQHVHLVNDPRSIQHAQPSNDPRIIQQHVQPLSDPRTMQHAQSLNDPRHMQVLTDPSHMQHVPPPIDPRSMQHVPPPIDPRIVQHGPPQIDPRSMQHVPPSIDPRIMQHMQPLNDPRVMQHPPPVNDPNSMQLVQPLNDPRIMQHVQSLNDPRIMQHVQPLNDPRIMQQAPPLNDPMIMQTAQLLSDPRFIQSLTALGYQNSFPSTSQDVNLNVQPPTLGRMMELDANNRQRLPMEIPREMNVDVSVPPSDDDDQNRSNSPLPNIPGTQKAPQISKLLFSCGQFVKSKTKKFQVFYAKISRLKDKYNLTGLMKGEKKPYFLKGLCQFVEFSAKIFIDETGTGVLYLSAPTTYLELLYNLVRHWLQLEDEDKDRAATSLLPKDKNELINLLREGLSEITEIHNPYELNDELKRLKAQLVLSKDFTTQAAIMKNLTDVQLKLVRVFHTAPRVPSPGLKIPALIRTLEQMPQTIVDPTNYLKILLVYNKMFLPFTPPKIDKVLTKDTKRIAADPIAYCPSFRYMTIIRHVMEYNEKLVEQNLPPIHIKNPLPDNPPEDSQQDVPNADMHQSVIAKNHGIAVPTTKMAGTNSVIRKGPVQCITTIVSRSGVTTRQSTQVRIVRGEKESAGDTFIPPELRTVQKPPSRTLTYCPINKHNVDKNSADVSKSRTEIIGTGKTNETEKSNDPSEEPTASQVSRWDTQPTKEMEALKAEAQEAVDAAFNFQLPHMSKSALKVKKKINNNTVTREHIDALKKLIVLEKKHQQYIHEYCSDLR